MWGRRDFRLAWFAGLVNNSGDWALNVALPVYVFTETGSGTTTAVLVVCQVLIGALISPFGGSWVDRWNLRRCLVGTNVLQAAALMPLLWVTPDRVWPAYIVVALQAALTTVNDPANMAILPRLVEPQQLAQANAALAAGMSVARFVGAPLGGLMLAVGGLEAVVVFDAVSFIVCALAVAAIRTPTDPLPSAGDPGPHPGFGVRAGFRAVRANSTLRVQIPLFALGQISQGGFLLLFVVFVVDVLEHDSTAVGTIRGTMAIGAVLGALLIGRAARRAQPTRLIAIGYLGMGITSLIFWNASYVTHVVWVMCVLFSLSGLPGAALQVGQNTTLQRVAPPAVLGRVTGIWLMADSIGTAVGSIAAGLLVDRTSVMLLLNVQGGITIGCAILAVAYLHMPRERA
ncbi:MAG TPA: MFS transporter [Ilumatobacter sp.]|nr:MFS transporter [Ilumatobacter sp.]